MGRAQEEDGSHVRAQTVEGGLPGDGPPLARAGLLVAVTYLAALAPLPAALSLWEAIDVLFLIQRNPGL